MNSVVYSVSRCPIFIARKWWRRLTYNIMPLRKGINILNSCLIYPGIHALWVNSRVFLLAFRRFLNITIIVSISFCSVFISRKRRWRLAYNIVPLWKWINIFNSCLIYPRIHSLWIYSWVFLLVFWMLLNITIIVSIPVCTIFISRKRRRRLAYNIVPLWKWIYILNSSLIYPWIHSLRIDSWIFIFLWFLNITIIVSISFCSIFITWKWRWRLADNIVPLRKSIDILNRCLVNPWIHSFRIYSWIFFLIFVFKLMKTTWIFSWWWLSVWIWWWSTRSWKFIIEHTFPYKMPYFRSNFFMAYIEIFLVVLRIKSCSFWVWISTFRISRCNSFFWI